MKIFNRSRNQMVANIRVADHFLARLRGWLFRRPEDEDGLWLIPCQAVHTLGVSFPLDLVFLNRDLKVVQIVRKVRPFSFFIFCRKAHSVLEFLSGRWKASQVALGDELEMRA